jgi:hypothetical protein
MLAAGLLAKKAGGILVVPSAISQCYDIIAANHVPRLPANCWSNRRSLFHSLGINV